MSELEKIYYSYQNDLDQDGDSEEVVATRDSLCSFLDNSHLNELDYDDLICAFADKTSKQGFINGFKYAMRIAMECMASKEGEHSGGKD